ncbi:hypothetical protein RsTz2092_01290 [Deferribacterales bacterium RsTz2092]|nr:hypothetical protein AGMMS49941_01980 [Deferribacterales bacterium]
MKRVYVCVLATFLSFCVFVNVVCALSLMNAGATLNVFYMSARASSVKRLVGHILFESGFFLKGDSPDDITGYLNESAKEVGLEPALVTALANMLGRGQYTISYNGAVGIMALQPEVMGDVDPFIAKNNIKTAIYYLAALLEQTSGDLPSALEIYLMPKKLYTGVRYEGTRQLISDVIECYNASACGR